MIPLYAVIAMNSAIRQSREYPGESALTRDDETGLHLHYGRPGYWIEEPDAAEQG